jgi:hypothetical protein
MKKNGIKLGKIGEIGRFWGIFGVKTVPGSGFFIENAEKMGSGGLFFAKFHTLYGFS